jgi:type IV pilus assembly protein PilW
MRQAIPGRQRQSGFTLIELMTAMAIGIIMVTGTLMIFDSFTRTVRVQNAVATMADSGRYAIDRVVRDLRMAGYRDEAWLRPAMENALVVENGSGASDSVTVRYEGDFDCTGAATVAPDFVVTNSFSVVNGNLVCNGEVIALGVEDFQILLGEDTDGDGGTNRLVAPGTASLDVSQISSIRVYLLLVTPEERVQRFSQVFSYFQNTDDSGQATSYDDGRRRLELAAVLATRNPVGT